MKKNMPAQDWFASGRKTKKIYIKGMHCVSCEKLLNDELKNIEKVKAVRANRKTCVVEIDYKKKEPAFSEIRKIAEKFGYSAFENNPGSDQDGSGDIDWIEWVYAILIVIVILFAYRILKNFGVVDKINLSGSEIGYGVAILIGLVASVSSCLAVVGAVVIAFGEKYKSSGGGFFDSAVKPNLFFHAGRLATFFALGGLLGLVGGEISISGNFISIFTMVIAVIMGWLGLNILGILPSISNLGVRMPGKFTAKWEHLKQSEHKAAPFLLGGISFFLPCGFTQSMQIFALTSGSFWVGGATMFLFALGTVPSLLALGITASWTQKKRMTVFQKVAGFIVFAFAVYTFQSGLALRGVEADILTTEQEQEISEKSENTSLNQEEQVVEMNIGYRGFEPSILRIKKGVPVKWMINGDNVTGCTNRIIIPSLKISKNIKYGKNVIRFTPEKSGTIPFSCWMGMVRGKFVVE